MCKVLFLVLSVKLLDIDFVGEKFMSGKCIHVWCGV